MSVVGLQDSYRRLKEIKLLFRIIHKVCLQDSYRRLKENQALLDMIKTLEFVEQL